MITCEVDTAAVEKELQEKLACISDRRGLFRDWSHAVSREAKRNALKRKKGGGFWLSIADSVRVSLVHNNGAEIKADHFAARHKHEGGTIRAKNAKSLTIPIAKEAKGKRAAAFEKGGRDLFVPKGTNVLGYSVDGQFHGLFALVKSVTHKAEPWWPSEDDVARLGMREAEHWLKKEVG